MANKKKGVSAFERTCICCREIKDAKNMLRIIKNKAGEINADPNHKLSGRGAYVCKNAACADDLIKKRALNRTFKQEIKQEIYIKILAELKNKE